MPIVGVGIAHRIWGDYRWAMPTLMLCYLCTVLEISGYLVRKLLSELPQGTTRNNGIQSFHGLSSQFFIPMMQKPNIASESVPEGRRVIESGV
jgi:hypothetical protein